ncbi:FtsX-like permease family protein [Candidatus Finniella inopinata]|uniref:FtsX-like permease family protein n=1 Tax=Candidatus Finniella inopinata TaxID=1696036 RepID=A0A4Q7DHH4_9PROT|nr:FtsX-like permease family protein [Candidatus Finniella inopinata]RZI46203.1 FtsX-like permease family protein [Candidatus Finniella inopinata]
MYYIALKMLFGDRGKYIAMVVGVSFAALIMTQQPAILVGLLSRTYSFIQDVSLPDIWVMDPGVQYVEEHKPVRDVELNKIRGVSGVAWATPLYKSLMSAKMPDGLSKTIDMTGLDDSTLVGAPFRILKGKLSDFKRADAIFVDFEAAQNRLRINVSPGVTRPLEVGDTLEINDKRAVVVGFIKATRNFVLQPQVYTTYSQALSYSAPGRRQLTYVLVKAKEGQNLRHICQKIEAKTGLKAYSADDFKDVNLGYWMKNTGIPINFGISVLLGFIVGAAIAGQTFFSFVQENVKHYAALKAMGLRSLLLAKMVILQALVVGFIGYGIGVGLATLFGLKFHDSVLAFRMPPILLLYSGGGVMVIIAIAAMAGIRRVINVDPAVVFRG